QAPLANGGDWCQIDNQAGRKRQNFDARASRLARNFPPLHTATQPLSASKQVVFKVSYQAAREFVF
ncbi:MAG: hypothetical protein ABIO78_06365, partial [Thermoanaerobaculia bacterium]